MLISFLGNNWNNVNSWFSGRYWHLLGTNYNKRTVESQRQFILLGRKGQCELDLAIEVYRNYSYRKRAVMFGSDRFFFFQHYPVQEMLLPDPAGGGWVGRRLVLILSSKVIAELWQCFQSWKDWKLNWLARVYAWCRTSTCKGRQQHCSSSTPI